MTGAAIPRQPPIAPRTYRSPPDSATDPAARIAAIFPAALRAGEMIAPA
jgi:hypothetical protein